MRDDQSPSALKAVAERSASEQRKRKNESLVTSGCADGDLVKNTQRGSAARLYFKIENFISDLLLPVATALRRQRAAPRRADRGAAERVESSAINAASYANAAFAAAMASVGDIETQHRARETQGVHFSSV